MRYLNIGPEKDDGARILITGRNCQQYMTRIGFLMVGSEYDTVQCLFCSPVYSSTDRNVFEMSIRLVHV